VIVSKPDEAANDEGDVSWDDAIALLDEIERLRTIVATNEARIAELDRLAHHDSLLGLPNRRCFFENLERLIARANRYDTETAVLFVDVDGLKAINDRHGHGAGDKALVEVSRLLIKAVRAGDLVARLAGDEFGILLENSNELTGWQTALRIIETIDDCEFCVDAVCLPLSVAVGVAVIRPDDCPESVVARADQEMYKIKGI